MTSQTREYGHGVDASAWLRPLIEMSPLTQPLIARRMGVSTSLIGHWLAGRRLMNPRRVACLRQLLNAAAEAEIQLCRAHRLELPCSACLKISTKVSTAWARPEHRGRQKD